MKGSKLPLYVLVGIIALALIYAIANPPAPRLPGPMGEFPTWKSAPARGAMTAQAVNADGTMWAGAWSRTAKDGTPEAAVHIIDLKGFSARSVDLGKSKSVHILSWADDGTLRADLTGGQVLLIDAKAGKQKESVRVDGVQNALCWPAGSAVFAAMLEENDRTARMAAFSDRGAAIGREVVYALPEDGGVDGGVGIADDGSSFVFRVSDPAAGDGKSFYLADTRTGAVKKAFDLGDLPGRVVGVWPSAGDVLIVCAVRATKGDRLQALVYSPASGKLAAQPRGVDLKKWPGAPKTVSMMTYYEGIEFDLSSGKTKRLFDLTEKSSAEEKGWRDFMRDSRLYRLDNGNYVAISDVGGSIDIREVKRDGSLGRAMLSRM